jgi:hypothetical protein
MKTIEDLRQFYQQQLTPDLQVLEKKRQTILNQIIFVAGGTFAVAGICIVIFASKSGDVVPCIIFPLFGAGVITGLVGWAISRGYTSDFKTMIIGRIVKFIDEKLTYDPGGHISKSEFNASKLFTTKPNRYKGDDLVYGIVGDTQIKFSEINAKYESGSGKNRSVKQIFKGLFFIGDFNKHFQGQTFVLPDVSESLFGKFGQKFQQWNLARPDLVKMEDPEFEKEFVVYSTDQVEARYILSTSLMERIVNFKRRTGNKIHMSFINSQVNVAISFKKNLFEPRLFQTLLDFSPIQDYFDDLQLAVGIVDDLNLNTRIWTKQ